jgi:carboxypeptidase C (cathepsin A)
MKILTAGLVAASVVGGFQGCASMPQSSTRPPQHRQLEQGSAADRLPAGPDGYFSTATSTTHGAVSVEGRGIQYRAVAGRIIVHGPAWHDDGAPGRRGGAKDVPPEAAMFYVAYLEDGANASRRPLTFLFNGGPGSSSLWLHVGGLGPQRVVTVGQSGTPASPFRLASNQYSLLDASDLVFIDAPGTGFGRIRGKGASKAFYGVDADVRAFAEFIAAFLSQNDRWNSPKYLVGEGYGAARAAALVDVLQTRNNVEFNGVILLSPALNLEVSGGVGALDPFNPGLDLPYELALPSFAAAAWYHNKLPGGREPLDRLLEKVGHFAMTDYARALRQGSLLTPAGRASVAEQLHEFTGLPISYIESANLRIDSGEFEQELLSGSGVTVSHLDARVAGPTLDPLSERGGYDPQGAAGEAAYVSAFNHYVRRTLRYGYGMTYEPDISVVGQWNFWHTPPGQSVPVQQWPNVMPDLASAMKYAPGLKIMVNGGYFDLATPFMTGSYEMHHLQIPTGLQGNIQYDYYRCGHMARIPLPELRNLHDNIAAFMDATDHSGTVVSNPQIP